MRFDIYLDIETLPASRPDIIERLTADVSPPANYKSEEAIAKWWAEKGQQAKDEAIATTALNGTWGEVLAIGIAVNERDPVVLIRGDAFPTERELIEHWALTVESEVNGACRYESEAIGWDTRAEWIGHNIEDFDLRFIRQRACINGVRLPFKLPLERYPRGPHRFDTMKEWGGWNGRVKQADMELAFGLTRNDTITGADVWRMWKEGNLALIHNHCREDVRLLREIHLRMVA
jgi:hypothetical protein